MSLDVGSNSTHRQNGMTASHVLKSAPHISTFFFFYIWSNAKFIIGWLDNNKKNYCEKTKKNLLTLALKILTFKGILVISLWFLIFYYWLNIKSALNWHYNDEKNIVKIFFNASFKFFFFNWYFNYFTKQLKWKRKRTCWFGNN
jgi:hypothetical protein